MNHSVNTLRGLVLVVLAVGVLAQPVIGAGQTFRSRASEIAYTGQFTDEDVKAEVAFGREVAARILGKYRLVRDDELTRYVNLVGRSVAMHCRRPELAFRFAVLDSSSINAYAAPGGYIFVTRGALDKLSDEAELAGVLAHEIAHAAERHIVKELNIKGSEQSAAAGIAHLLGAMGDPTRVAFKQAVDKAMAILFEKGYKKRDEFEADKTGTLMLAATGYDPAALSRYLERIEKVRTDEVKILNDTHPEYDKRLAALLEVLAVNGLEKINNPTVKQRYEKYVH